MGSLQHVHVRREQRLALWTWRLEGCPTVAYIVADLDDAEAGASRPMLECDLGAPRTRGREWLAARRTRARCGRRQRNATRHVRTSGR